MSEDATDYLEKARHLDFERLKDLVVERIDALKLYVDNIDKADGTPELHNAICRDLVFPNINVLAAFIQAVQFEFVEDPAAGPDEELSPQ